MTGEARPIDTGGPAFPFPVVSQNQGTGETSIWQTEGGMTLRDYHIAHSPVDYGVAAAMLGKYFDALDLSDDKDRAAFISEWAMLRAEMADAMIKARAG